jgi:hypothetical protein
VTHIAAFVSEDGFQQIHSSNVAGRHCSTRGNLHRTYASYHHVVVNENRAGMISQSFSNMDDISLISYVDLFGRVWTCFVSRPCPGVFRLSCNGILEVYEKLIFLKLQARALSRRLVRHMTKK